MATDELGLLLGGLALVGVVVALALRGARAGREADARLYASVDRCLMEVARRHGLRLEGYDPVEHPVAGSIAVPSRLRGTVEGFAVSLGIESGPSMDGDLELVLRLSAPASCADWPRVARACRDRHALPAPAREALRRLCERAREVEVEPRTLRVLPDVAARTDWRGHTRRVETDPDRLDALLRLALHACRELSSAGAMDDAG